MTSTEHGLVARIGIAGVRLLAAAASVVVGVALVGFVTTTASPSSEAPLPAQTVTPVSAQLERLCPGALLSQSANDVITRSGSTQLTAADARGGAVSVATLAATASAAQRVTAPAGDGASLSAAQAQGPTGETTGLAASACLASSGDSWIVAGASTTGRTSILRVLNPSSIPATVTVRLWSEAGAVSAPGLTGIIVGAGAERDLPLAGVRGGTSSPVFQVSSTGGLVVASLQQTVLRALTPGGADVVAGGASPSTSVTIPGVVIAGSADVAGMSGDTDSGDTVPALRLLAPRADTAATIRVSNDAGTQVSTTAQLKAGVVSELPLDGLVDGDYTVRVTAAHEVVAAVRATTATADPTTGSTDSDFAWFEAAPVLGAAAQVSVAGLPGVTAAAALHLAAGAAAMRVSVAVLGGATSEVAVAAGGSASVPLPTGATVRISGAAGGVASVSFAGEALLASYPVVSAGAVSGAIVVRPR